jgi:hypothetical protein
MHFLVPQGELGEVEIGAAAFELVRYPVQNRFPIGQCLPKRRQRQAPARVVRHGGRVVERVGVGQNRRPGFAALPQAPELLEPAHMTHLPARRIDDRQQRAELALAGEVVDHAPRALARFAQLPDQVGGFHREQSSQ